MIQRAAELGIANKMLFAGWVKGEELDKLYAMADLYVMPSVSEPFGLIPLEAIEYGVPVVLSSNSGVKEVVSHSLKADFWDIEKMANYVLAVAKYPALKRMLSRKSFQETRYLNWDDQAGKVHAIYQELTSTK